MKIFCISDLHMGDGSATDNFGVGTRRVRFNRWIDYVEASGGQVMVLGDAFELDQAYAAWVLYYYTAELDRLGHLNVGYIVGNHDAHFHGLHRTRFLPSHPFFQHMDEASTLTLGKRRFLFMHGHEADPYCNTPYPGMGTLTALLSARKERRNKSPFLEDGTAVEDASTGVLEELVSRWNQLWGVQARSEQLITKVEEERVRRGADVVIYGHTHRPGHIGDYHYNTGCWCRKEGEETFAVIDDQTGEVQLYRWTLECEEVPFGVELRADCSV